MFPLEFTAAGRNPLPAAAGRFALKWPETDTQRIVVTPDDVRLVGSICEEALGEHTMADWDRPAPDLEWSCRETLVHVVSSVLYYAGNLAMRADEPQSAGDAESTLPLDFLVSALVTRAAVLAEVCAAAPSDARGAGADASGIAAVGCDEMLIHTYDIMGGLEAVFSPPADICSPVLARLFPWAPPDEDPWAALLWANGRAALGDRPRLGPDWKIHIQPLNEWDGNDPTVRS